TRTHSHEQISQIAASIREFGFCNPVLVDADNLLIAGHGRLEAAKALGITEIPAIVLEGLSDAQKQALRLADNKLALNAGWDDDLLRTELLDLRDVGFDLSVMGFGADELASIFADANAGLTDPDDVPEAPLEPVTRLGDVWLLGRHRLVCGDATSEVDVSLALAGVRPHLMVTDPPYGVDYTPTWRDDANRQGILNHIGRDRSVGLVVNDTQSDWSNAWALFSGDVVYVWHPDRYASNVQASLEITGYEIRCQIIWAKSSFAISRGHYNWQHEPCWYAVRRGKTGHWQGNHSASTLWEITHHKNETGHSAQKPVECMRRPIENNSSPGQAVYDPFVGSGTTIIAAEMTGRACHAIEISPAYCDVAVLRWQAFTGQTATRPDGTPFGAAHVEATPRQATVSAD
ncbi:MAG TPA: site-specific DNA-methyltransferase, partial [Acetobacteraceae bacterium]